MAGNKAGGKKAVETMRKKLGVEGEKQWRKEITSKGGRAKSKKGFALLDKATHIKVAASGGRAPRKVPIRVVKKDE